MTATPLNLIPKSEVALTAKDFKSDQEVRWCPGCGDYSILSTVQGFLPELGLARENIVFISGIGCSSRFPYYMNTFGMHSIHGRAPAIASGLAISRPDLSIWVITGDGDSLSIGGNHLIHALRRNVNLKILMFNNRIYGLTKGQYSPTSEQGKITKSTPEGSLDYAVQPGVARAGRGGHVRRPHDGLRPQAHDGRAAPGRRPRGRRSRGDLPELQHLQRRRLGAAEGQRHPRRPDDPPGRRGADPLRPREREGRRAHSRRPHRGGGGRRGRRGRRHPARRPGQGSRPGVRAVPPVEPTDAREHPIGVFRDIQRPSYDRLVREQIERSSSARALATCRRCSTATTPGPSPEQTPAAHIAGRRRAPPGVRGLRAVGLVPALLPPARRRLARGDRRQPGRVVAGLPRDPDRRHASWAKTLAAARSAATSCTWRWPRPSSP